MKDLRESKTEEMNSIESQLFIKCTMLELSKSKVKIEDDVMTLINNRLKQYNIEATIPLIMFLSTLCDTPAKAVMWAYTLFKMYDNKIIDIKHFAAEFMDGIPTDEGYREMWENQKNVDAPLGNLLDGDWNE